MPSFGRRGADHIPLRAAAVDVVDAIAYLSERNPTVYLDRLGDAGQCRKKAADVRLTHGCHKTGFRMLHDLLALQELRRVQPLAGADPRHHRKEVLTNGLNRPRATCTSTALLAPERLRRAATEAFAGVVHPRRRCSPPAASSLPPVLHGEAGDAFQMGDVVGDEDSVERKRVCGDRDVEILETDTALLEICLDASELAADLVGPVRTEQLFRKTSKRCRSRVLRPDRGSRASPYSISAITVDTRTRWCAGAS